MLFFTLICGFVMISILSWLNMLKDSKKSNLPTPRLLPFIGNGYFFMGDSAQFLQTLSDLAEKFNDAFQMYIMSQRYIVLSHPNYIEKLVSSTEIITKGLAYTFLYPWLGQGLLTATGYRWKSHRRFLTPAFHFNVLQNFLPVFLNNEKILRGQLRKRADGSEVDIFPIITLNALDNVTESIMGVSLHTQVDKESEYVKAIEDVTRIISIRARQPLLAYDFVFNLTSHKKIQDKAISILHGHTNRVINARRKELLNSQFETVNDEEAELGVKNRRAFLDLLLTVQVDGKPLDNEKIREEVDTFMFEGHDTTASGISYCLYCIAKHADVQQKILDEQKSILGDDLERDPTYSDLQQMKYLENVIKESLRIFPSVPLIQRSITEDIELSGIKLRKGTTVFVNIFRMHRNPELFEEPLLFKPERFMTSNKNPFSWLAFSAGPRNCIGQKFAMMEMKATIAATVKHFKLLPTNADPIPCGDVVLRSKNGVLVKILPRN